MHFTAGVRIPGTAWRRAQIHRGEVILQAQVIGGIQMIDHGEADDKIIAVLKNDNFRGEAHDISAIPPRLVERLKHYFMPYLPLV